MLITNLFLLLFFSNPTFNTSTYFIDKASVTAIENNFYQGYEGYEEIDPFIDELYYQDKKVRDIGKNNLLQIAKKSSFFRNAVIKALTRVLRDKRLLITQKEFRYQTWYDAVELLGELNAVETVDLLIENLDYTIDKKDISLNYYPSIKAIASIANVTKFRFSCIDKLSKALRENKNPIIRINSAKCLSLIEGKEARVVLLKAFELEKDFQVKRQIQVVLTKPSLSGLGF